MWQGLKNLLYSDNGNWLRLFFIFIEALIIKGMMAKAKG